MILIRFYPCAIPIPSETAVIGWLLVMLKSLYMDYETIRQCPVGGQKDPATAQTMIVDQRLLSSRVIHKDDSLQVED